MNKRNIHIIGGAKGIGRWMIEKVFLQSQDTVYCYDIDKKALQSLPDSVKKCDISNSSYKEHASNFQNNDWILLAVPLNEVEKILQSLTQILNKGSLVITLTSVQEKAVKLLKSYLPMTCVPLGCHPLFGHTVPSPIGQIVALTEYNDRLSQHKEFRKKLLDVGLQVVDDLSACDHDRYMSIVQALTHFCLLTFAGTIAKDNLKPSKLLKLRTPNFQFLYAFASRVLMLSSTTTGAIQSTEEASKIREAFINTAHELHDKFQSATDIKEHACIIEELRDPLTGAEVAEGVEIAAIAVDGYQRFEALIYKYKNSGSPFVFRHKNTGKIHVVKILSIHPDEVMYEESTKVIGEQLVIGLSETARTNYKKYHGISLSKPREAKIKKRNIKLLTAEELKDFYRNRILPIKIKCNFQNKYNLKEDYFEEWLPRLIKGLWQCEFLEAYRRRNEIEKVTLKLTFNPNIDKDTIIKRVREVVEEQKLHLNN